MDTSKFNLWRACFSFCQVDNELARKEREWIETKINDLNFNEDQKNQLISDLSSPPDINSILPLITKPSDRAFLVDQMRVLSRIDGQFSQAERLKIEEVKTKILSKVNLSELEGKVAADEKASYHEDEVYKVHNKDSFMERLHMELMKLLNPGDYKFPGKE